MDSCIDCELATPTVTFPKLALLGVIVSAGAVAAVPVPLNATDVGELEPLLVKLMLPVKFPALVGANNTAKDALPPAATVAGVVSPLTL